MLRIKEEMTKVGMNLRKMATIAVCLAGITVFSGCDKDPNGDENGNTGGTPEAVMNFTATAGDKQVSLAWDAPSDNGRSEIIGYEVTMDNWVSKVSKTASERSHTYPNLTNGTEYTFKVRAVNAKGAGAESVKTATPKEGGSTGNEGYTLPQNLKLVYTVYNVNEGVNATLIVTIIKIENNYYSEHANKNGETILNSQRFFKDNGNGTWTFNMYSHPEWVKPPKSIFSETELFKSADGLESFPFYWQILSSSSSWAYTTQTGTGTICGRPVKILQDDFGSNIFYVDTENGMTLKGTTNIDWEVIEWDDTVEDFDGIDLPE